MGAIYFPCVLGTARSFGYFEIV